MLFAPRCEAVGQSHWAPLPAGLSGKQRRAATGTPLITPLALNRFGETSISDGKQHGPRNRGGLASNHGANWGATQLGEQIMTKSDHHKPINFVGLYFIDEEGYETGQIIAEISDG